MFKLSNAVNFVRRFLGYTIYNTIMSTLLCNYYIPLIYCYDRPCLYDSIRQPGKF